MNLFQVSTLASPFLQRKENSFSAILSVRAISYTHFTKQLTHLFYSEEQEGVGGVWKGDYAGYTCCLASTIRLCTACACSERARVQLRMYVRRSICM